MRKTSSKVVLLSLSLLLPAAFLQPACGGSSTESTGTGGAGGATFESSACHTCEKEACASELGTCQAEPECAARVDCENACAVAPSGDADAACAEACKAPDQGAAKTAFDALQACRFGGPGAACAACGRTSTGSGGTGGAPLCTPPAVLAQTCPAYDDPSPCIQCQFEKCCDSVDLVYGGGPATDLGDCYAACNDDACVEGCFNTFPDGIPAFQGYRACSFVNCFGTGACPTNPCSTCQYKECSCEYASYITDPEGTAIDRCISLCASGDVACAKACVTSHPQGQPLYDSLAVCTGQKCIQDCGG